MPKRTEYIITLHGEESVSFTMSLTPDEFEFLKQMIVRCNEHASFVKYSPTMAIKPSIGCCYCQPMPPQDNYCKECGRKLK